MNDFLRRAKAWSAAAVDRHRLPSAVLLVIGIALALTAMNMWLYVHSGASGLDLSRPGYDMARENIQTSQNEPEFSAEGPLSVEIIDGFLVDYRAKTTQSAQLGQFTLEPLSNEVLNFNVPEVDVDQAAIQ